MRPPASFASRSSRYKGILPGIGSSVTVRSPAQANGCIGFTSTRSTRAGSSTSKTGLAARTSSSSPGAYTVNGWLSRRTRSPAIASMSPPVSNTPVIGESRPSVRGQSRGVCSSCWRKSGEAPTSNQLSPSPETATLACVAARTRGSRARAKPHRRHPQFHCGNPPPAADAKHHGNRPEAADQSCLINRTAGSDAGGEIPVDFHSEADFTQRRASPCHKSSPACYYETSISPWSPHAG